MRGVSDPTSHFLVGKIMTGIRKTSPSSDVRLPITLPILYSIIEAIPKVGWSNYMATAYQAMISLSFHAFLRPGEVTESVNILNYENITFRTGSITITFFRFKHHVGDPFSIEILQGETLICPIRLLGNFIKLRGTTPGPLFCRSSLKAISYSEYNKAFATIRTFLQLPGTITPHSARIGAATHAASMGTSEILIQKMGRWKSNAYLKYIRISTLVMR